MTDIRVNSFTIPLMPSLVHMLDYQRIGEVAGRSLPLLAASRCRWLRFGCVLPSAPQGALHLRSRSGVSGYISFDTIRHSAC